MKAVVSSELNSVTSTRDSELSERDGHNKDNIRLSAVHDEGNQESDRIRKVKERGPIPSVSLSVGQDKWYGLWLFINV